MRTLVRVGSVVGVCAGGLAVALTPHLALSVVAVVLLAGAVAGLGAAKWLARGWYGRQFQAGLAAGALAAGLAGMGALGMLLSGGPRDVAALARASALPGVSLSGLVTLVSGFGWLGAEISSIVGGVLAGILIAGVVTQIFAWSKSRHAVEVVEQARQAALALGGAADTGGDALPLVEQRQHITERQHITGGRAPIALAAPGPATLASLRAVRAPDEIAVAEAPMPAPVRSTLAPRVRPTNGPASPAGPVRPTMPPQARPSAGPARGQPPTPPAGAPAAKPELVLVGAAAQGRGRNRKRSSARSVKKQLTDEMRAALEAWAREDDATAGDDAEVDAATPSRAPQPSTYLNSTAPKRRNRKKAVTRDWIC